MRFRTISHRFGKAIAVEPEFRSDWFELLSVIESVTDDDIMEEHSKNTPNRKSISMAINNLLKSRLVKKGWAPESAIFNDPDYHQTRWRLDFSKNDISVEVAFNHGEAIAWNLLKPVLASELNHVEKHGRIRWGGWHLREGGEVPQASPEPTLLPDGADWPRGSGEILRRTPRKAEESCFCRHRS